MFATSPFLQASFLIAGYLAFSLWCYRKPILTLWHQRKNRATQYVVAYASESGSAVKLAHDLQSKIVSQQASCTCLNLNQLEQYPLEKVSYLLLVVSTYGEGEAPDNGRFFVAHLSKKERDLSSLQHAVLALGDRDYKQFCQFGLDVNESLISASSRPLFAPVLVNRLASQSIASWYTQLRSTNILKVSSPETETEEQLVNSDMSDIKMYALSLSDRKQVNFGSPGAPLYEIHFEVPNALTWQAGDIARLHIEDKVREYSIASLPQEGKLTLLVREQKHPNGELGLGSGWLCHKAAMHQPNTISVRSNPKFHPYDKQQKLILIGNGSGLAGLRAHLKYRELNNQSENWLFYGERCASTDLPWHEQLITWARSDHLTHLDFAFSRQILDSRIKVGKVHTGYVQDVLLAQSEQLKIWITEGAAILICGSLQGMAKGVENALIEILGASTLENLIAEGRYRRDVY